MNEKEKLKIREKFITDLRQHLKRYDAFESIDKHALNRLADWQMNYLQAKEDVETDGATQVSKNGYKTMSGSYQAMIAAEKVLQSLYSKYGIDTITRDKLKFESKKKETQDDGLIK